MKKIYNKSHFKKGRSLKMLISIPFMALMIITIGIIAVIVFYRWKTSVFNTMTKIEADASRDVLNGIESLINRPLYINEMNHNLIQNGAIDINNSNERNTFFAGIIKSNSEEIYSFSYGNEKGEYYGARRNEENAVEIYKCDAETHWDSYYYSTNDDLTSGNFIKDYGKFDPRTRDWYKIAKDKGRPVFSPIYKHFIKDDLAISAAYPIYNKDGTLRGVMGTHITLSNLNGNLKELLNDKMTDAYIIEKDTGDMVANSIDKPNYKKQGDGSFNRISIGEMSSDPIKKAYEKYKSTLKSNIVINSGGNNIHISFTEYKKYSLDWLIITATPESIYTAEINRNIFTAIFLSIIAVILSLLIYSKSTQIILKPIDNLIEATDKFSRGDFLHRARIYRNDEIGKLAAAFNFMAEEMYNLINSLEEKVKDRTIELEHSNSALLKSEENIRILLDSTAEGIYGIDMNGNCTFCNASCLKILGYSQQDELIGRNMHNMIHHKYADGTHFPVEECKIYKAFMTGEHVHVDDEVLWCADETSFAAEYFSYPQYRNGVIIGAVVTFMDITERKRTQSELIIAKEQAEAASIEKSQFLANMSHEIRTPMNGIVGFLQLLEDTELNGDQSDFVHMIKTSTDNLLHVINDILDISKIEAGRMELENIPFDIRSMIESAVILFDAKAREKGLELNMLISSNIPQFVTGDPTKLRQIISNLVSNAIKFTGEGEVYLEASIVNDEEDIVEISFNIKDTGIGMSEQEVEKLFKPFSQADSSSTRKYGGTGLGLAISKRLVEMMDGEIYVISEKGKGSEFHFVVKLNKARGSIIPCLPDYTILKGKSILIVDDHSMNRYIAKAYLEETGCVVTEADGAADALGKLDYPYKGLQYDLVLVDYKMKGMTGFDFSSIVKQKSSLERLPLILFTSVTVNSEAKQAKERGFAGYISKPYKRNDLLDCIAMVLGDSNQESKEEKILINRHTVQESIYRKRLKVLLAEDNDLNTKFFTKLLKMKGLGCDIAVNGLEAVKACQKNDYDIIFMDCQMPIVDGYEAARQIRLMEKGRHTPIIAMTAYAMTGDLEKCLNSGMDEYLSKPVNISQLMNIIKKYSNGYDNENDKCNENNEFTD